MLVTEGRITCLTNTQVIRSIYFCKASKAGAVGLVPMRAGADTRKAKNVRHMPKGINVTYL